MQPNDGAEGRGKGSAAVFRVTSGNDRYCGSGFLFAYRIENSKTQKKIGEFKFHSLNYHLKSHLSKNYFLYIFPLQQLFYILFTL